MKISNLCGSIGFGSERLAAKIEIKKFFKLQILPIMKGGKKIHKFMCFLNFKVITQTPNNRVNPKIRY